MINKQVKIVGGVSRSTPIDLKTIDAEVAALAGRSPRTPIGMKELWDEVQSLKESQIKKYIIPQDSSTAVSEKILAQLTTNNTQICGYLNFTFKTSNTETKTMVINNVSGNFENKVTSTVQYGNGKRAYVVVRRSGNTITIAKSSETTANYNVTVNNGFIFY